MKQWLTVVIALMVLSSMALHAQQNETIPSNVFGSTRFLVAGYGFTNFEKEEHAVSNFEAGFNTIFLWKLQNKLFFESEVEFELEDGVTGVGLEYAQLFYVMNDYLSLGAGKFMNPINVFMERLHPTWINKLPDMPLGVSGHGGVPLLASTQLGLQARGAVAVGTGKITYSVYVSNGPILNVEEEEEPVLSKLTDGDGDDHGHGVAESGTLNFNNTSDNNDNKAIGGRLAFFLLPQLEIGVGLETATVGSNETPYSNVKALNNTVDVAFTHDVNALKGKVDLRGQYVRLEVDNPDIHPLEFENVSSAVYAQLAFQPSKVENSFFKNLEIVGRFDQLDLPAEAPLNVDQDRISVGLNYWFAPSAVFKVAFESIKSKHEDEEETETKIISQFSIGF